MFYDRSNGNTVYTRSGNPPVGISTNVRNGNLQTLGQSGLEHADAVIDDRLLSTIRSCRPRCSGTSASQMTLPWSSSLDVSYVGSHAYNILGQNPDLNAPDLGSAYLPQNQDLTLAASTMPGGTAVTTDSCGRTAASARSTRRGARTGTGTTRSR